MVTEAKPRLLEITVVKHDQEEEEVLKPSRYSRRLI